MKKLDKKQVPQFIALCVLTAGVSGYLVMHLVAPSQVSAGTRPPATPNATPTPAATPAPAPGQPSSAATVSGPGTPAVAAVPDVTDAPPPSPTMHDPFAPGFVDPSTLPAKAGAKPAAPALPGLSSGTGKQTASALETMPVSFPPAPALPGSLSGFQSHGNASMPGLPAAPAAPALPTAPAAPAWTVTGVLQGADGKVAILRSGDARRIVRSGEFVDGMFRVTGVTRTSVTLRHGTASYQLILGAAKAGPAAAGAAAPGAAPGLPFFATPSAPVSRPAPRPAAVIDGAVIPIYRTARPQPTLAPLRRQDQALLAAEPLSVPNPSPSAAQVAAEISRGLRMHSETAL